MPLQGAPVPTGPARASALAPNPGPHGVQDCQEGCAADKGAAGVNEPQPALGRTAAAGPGPESPSSRRLWLLASAAAVAKVVWSCPPMSDGPWIAARRGSGGVRIDPVFP